MRKKPLFRQGRPPNTFIGGVGATIVTGTTQLAAKLSVSSGQIHNFSIDSNNNVSCYIGRNYTMNARAFYYDNDITYYFDLDGKCTYLENQVFHNNKNISKYHVLIFPSVTGCDYGLSSGGGAGTRNKAGIMCFPKMEPIGPSGTTNSNCFSWCDFNGNVYVESANQTNNLGAPDLDITGAVSSAIASRIVYSTNTNAPSEATGISTISATTTSIHIQWDAVSHSNTIDYYLVIVDGNFVGSPSTTSLNVGGLTTATSYDFKIIVVDEMGNTSKFSNVYADSTL